MILVVGKDASAYAAYEVSRWEREFIQIPDAPIPVKGLKTPLADILNHLQNGPFSLADAIRMKDGRVDGLRSDRWMWAPNNLFGAGVCFGHLLCHPLAEVIVDARGGEPIDVRVRWKHSHRLVFRVAGKVTDLRVLMRISEYRCKIEQPERSLAVWFDQIGMRGIY